MCGEAGETANVVKKIERGDMTLDEARPLLADELADVICYAVIVAERAGINLGDAVVKKFNQVSDTVKVGIKIGHNRYMIDTRTRNERGGVSSDDCG
jgi:NTP pyrophosphatase (non-canonical NTP hydrolase)